MTASTEWEAEASLPGMIWRRTKFAGWKGSLAPAAYGTAYLLPVIPTLHLAKNGDVISVDGLDQARAELSEIEKSQKAVLFGTGKVREQALSDAAITAKAREFWNGARTAALLAKSTKPGGTFPTMINDAILGANVPATITAKRMDGVACGKNQICRAASLSVRLTPDGIEIAKQRLGVVLTPAARNATVTEYVLEQDVLVTLDPDSGEMFEIRQTRKSRTVLLSGKKTTLLSDENHIDVDIERN